MMITIPFWLFTELQTTHLLLLLHATQASSQALYIEWAGWGYLNDVHVKEMVVTLGYVMLGGAFCEWCWIVKGCSQGANKRMAAIYRTQFKLLMRWCLLIGMFCFAVLIFLILARGNITSMRGYIQVCVEQYVQFIWFPMKLAGYTCMIIVRPGGFNVLSLPPGLSATSFKRGQKDAADKAVNSATGQHALSNTSARQSHLVAMVQNLPNFPAQMLTPTQKLDKQVAEQLQEASMSRCMLNACHWERCLNPAGLLPARICDELNSLPAPVLHGLVQDTPLCVISALIWQLAAVPAVWGRDRNKDFDVVEDIDRGMPGAARIGYPASPGACF
ncbi:hypothetical protein WJX77_003130 [Trebouxia sp. C0004]